MLLTAPLPWKWHSQSETGDEEAAEQKGQRSAGVRQAHPSALPSAPSQVLLNTMKTFSIPSCPTLGESVSRALCTSPGLALRLFLNSWSGFSFDGGDPTPSGSLSGWEGLSRTFR